MYNIWKLAMKSMILIRCAKDVTHAMSYGIYLGYQLGQISRACVINEAAAYGGWASQKQSHKRFRIDTLFLKIMCVIHCHNVIRSKD